jgi:hypothetical protein
LQAVWKPVLRIPLLCVHWNSWWWREELSETRRVLFQNKIEKLVRLVGFFYTKYREKFIVLYIGILSAFIYAVWWRLMKAEHVAIACTLEYS